MTVKELKQILECYPEDGSLTFSFRGNPVMIPDVLISYGGEVSSYIDSNDWLDPTEFIRGLEGANQ